MQKFILRFILFIMPPVILAFSLEAYVSLTPNTFNTKSNYIKKNLEVIEVIILGSSHNQNAINPKYLSAKTANLAYGRQDLQLDSQLLYKYLPNLNKLKLVIIELSYHTLEDRNPHDYWRNSYYLRYHGISNFQTIKIMNWSIFFSNPKFFRQDILRRINPYSYKYIINEYGFVENDFRDRFFNLNFDKNKIWESRSKSRHKTQSIQNYISNSQIIAEMLAYCSQNNVNVLFLSPPVYETYYSEMVSDKKNRRKVFLENYNDVVFLNYENSDHFNIRDFKDDDHLSSAGAIKFTKLLDAQIVSIVSRATAEKNQSREGVGTLF